MKGLKSPAALEGGLTWMWERQMPGRLEKSVDCWKPGRVQDDL